MAASSLEQSLRTASACGLPKKHECLHLLLSFALPDPLLCVWQDGEAGEKTIDYNAFVDIVTGKDTTPDNEWNLNLL